MIGPGPLRSVGLVGAGFLLIVCGVVGSGSAAFAVCQGDENTCSALLPLVPLGLIVFGAMVALGGYIEALTWVRAGQSDADKETERV